MKPYESLDAAQKRTVRKRQEMAARSSLPELDRRAKWVEVRAAYYEYLATRQRPLWEIKLRDYLASTGAV